MVRMLPCFRRWSKVTTRLEAQEAVAEPAAAGQNVNRTGLGGYTERCRCAAQLKQLVVHLEVED